jgi:putative peptide zinc metalloprotease protein
MTALDSPPSPHPAVAAAPLAPDATLAVRPLSVVPEGEEFLVGDPASMTYVLLPAVGVRVIRLLQAGRTVGAAAAEVGVDVDVPDFVATLRDLGFVSVDPAGMEAGCPAARRLPPALVRPFFGRAAWALYAACAVLAAVIGVTRPDLLPRWRDLYFLPSPLASVAGVTLLTYALSAAHEVCHWAAARAQGLDARLAVGRRLYFLVFETDLSQLWGLPRRRRYGPLLAGMAFDAVVLCGVLVARFGAADGWWSLSPGVDHLLAALAVIELSALVAQGYVFMRTDGYALLITATGCVNLWRVNQLRLLGRVRRLRADERRELAEAHPRDLAVARWYAWVYLAGLVVAAGFFVGYYLPALGYLAGWLVGTLAAARLTTTAFWQAALLAVIVLSPSALTGAIAVRDLCRARRWHPAKHIPGRRAHHSGTVPAPDPFIPAERDR